MRAAVEVATTIPWQLLESFVSINNDSYIRLSSGTGKRPGHHTCKITSGYREFKHGKLGLGAVLTTALRVHIRHNRYD